MNDVLVYRMRTPKEFWDDVRKHGGLVLDRKKAKKKKVEVDQEELIILREKAQCWDDHCESLLKKK